MNAGIYLDHAATTPVDPMVRDAMLPFLGDVYGNPSSVHRAGRAARNAVDEARDRLAAVLQCAHRELVFTGSGTEADNLAIRGVVERWGEERGRHIVITAIEHDAVLETARRLQEGGEGLVTIVGCDTACRVDPEEVAAAVRPDTALVSVMFVNNETGVTQDVAAVAAAVRRRNPRTLIHSDAVQALPRLAVKPDALDVDLLSMSAHKLNGPKGVGALWVRHGTAIAAQLTGGGQERNRRSGTENVAGIVGFSVAAEVTAQRREREMARQTTLCDKLERELSRRVEGIVFNGNGTNRVPGFVSCAIPGARTDLLLTILDGKGVCASGGSACSSGAPTPSHVLLAMGLDPELATGALRLTTGIATTESDIAAAGEAVGDAVAQLREARVAAAG